MSLKKYLQHNTPVILSGLASIGVIVTAVTAVKATPKAIQLLEEAEKNKGEELSKWEKAKATALTYLPSILIGGTTIICIFGAQSLNRKQQASMMSAYAMLDQSYKDYRRKLKELYGEEADHRIIEALAVEKSEKVSVTASCLLHDVDLSIGGHEGESVLWYDEFSKRFFEATIEQVLTAEYHINRNYILAGEENVNEFYEFLGLEGIEKGDCIGWTPYDEGEYWIDFNPDKAQLKDGTNFYNIEMLFRPRFKYWEEPY